MTDNKDVTRVALDKQSLIRKAADMKSSGKYNCAQAVACAFADSIGANEDEIYSIGNAFGRGMGCMEATCGALTGAGIIIGIASGDRVKSMQAMAAILRRFEERNGATICKHLKGIAIDPHSGKTTAGHPLRPCDLCVADSAEFLADALSRL